MAIHLFSRLQRNDRGGGDRRGAKIGARPDLNAKSRPREKWACSQFNVVYEVQTALRHSANWCLKSIDTIWQFRSRTFQALLLVGMLLCPAAVFGDLQAAGNPTISSLSPSSGRVGAQITIHGSSFGATNNMVIFRASDGGIKYIGGRPERGGQLSIPSPDGTSITFAVPSTVQSSCLGPAHCSPREEAVAAGSYAVQVVRLDADTNAPSNIVPFMVQ